MKIRTRCFAYMLVLFFGILLSACTGLTPVPAQTPTPEKLSVGITPAAYPQIVRQNPLAGERLGLSPNIEIVFDRPMQPDKTAAAWQFIDADGKAVAGKTSWSDPQTFQFRPDQPLKPGQAYTGIFSVTASGADGSQLPEEIRLAYHATDELAVGQVFPADKAEDVDNKTAITVIFNKPVVPLMTKEEQAKLPSPISIQPQVSGTGSWVNTSVYVFQAESGLKSGTAYQVQVRSDLKDTTGTLLDKAYDWGFTTQAPSVADFGLKDLGQGFSGTVSNVLLDQAFIVTFNQPMETASVAAGLSVTNIETGQNFPVKLSWDKDSTVLTVTPANRFTIASFYNLTIAETAKAQDGGTLKEPYQIKLSTVPLPAISSASPSSGKQSEYSSLASVQFNTPMKSDSMQSRVKVLPEPKVPVKLFYREGSNQLDILGLEPSRDYVIRLLPGMTDIYGNAIKTEYSFSFETASLSPQARLVTPGYPLIYRSQSEQGVYFEYTNLDSAKIQLYSLSFKEFSALTLGTPEMDNLGEGSGTLLREWTPDLQAGKDQFARLLLRLDDQKTLAPGYYYLGLAAAPLSPQHRFLQGATFIVSNDSLALKATQGEALAWLVDSQTGQPVPDEPLVFYNDTMATVGQGVTDKDGLVHLADATNVQYVQSVDEKHLAMTALSWGSGVNEGQSGVWTDYWTAVKSNFAYTYTERSLYRPDQPVYIKGIVRAYDDLHYSLPALEQVYLTIENQQGKVFGGYVALSKNGTFASQYQLGTDAPVGNYSISVREKPDASDVLSWSTFDVAEYVKPEFQVTAATDRPVVLNGDEVKFSLDAAYYSGGSLGNANVAWFMELQPYYYPAPEPYTNYSFSDFDYYDYYYNGGSASNGPPVIKEGQGQTDAKGHFEMLQTMELPKDGVSQQVAFSANVTDVGGNLVGSSASLTVLGSALHAGIRPENYVAKAGEAQTFNLVVLDVDGKPVAKQAVSVAFVEQRWFSVVRKDATGLSSWDTSVKNIPAGSASATTDDKGLATVTFTPPAGGEYKAILTAKDAKGRPSKASSYLWVSSTDYIPWRQTNDRSFQLIADKSSYNPGDTAKILIAQPFEGENYALITTERGHIYEQKVIKLQNNSTLYELPITSDMAPVMYVSVMVVKGADGKTPPDFKMGMLRVDINPSHQSIFVTLESDKSTARPGDAVTYTVKTKDLDGKPVKADISLALVDKAALALAPANSQPLLDAFYPVRGLSVISASSIVLNAEEFNANYQATTPTGQQAGSGGGKGSGDNGIITVRQNFKDTAFWQAQVLTDENGTAQVKVTLPDNLTTWQMKARAVTDDTRVGEAQSELLSTRPLQVQLQTPRFFVVDDNVSLGAVVHNNTSQTLSVKVSLKAEGLTLSSPEVQTVSVASNQQAYVAWEALVAHSAQRVDLVASVESGSYSDSTRPTLGTLPGQGLPVLSYHVTETVGSSGFLREAGSTTEAINLPKTLDYLNATLNLNVSPSLAASMTDGLTYLNDYPYLCMEQTVSRFLPNLISLEALKLAGKSSDDLQKSLDQQVQPALQRIISNQNSDGGWGLWPGSDSQPTTTAYVIVGLVEAKKAGYTFPDSTEEQGLTYLNENLSYYFYSNDTWQNNQAAFVLYALAQGGKPNGSRVSALYDSRQKLDIYGRALLMQAMYLEDPKDERIKGLLSEINSVAAKSAAGSWWNEKEVDYWNWNTDLRTTAIVLNALIQVDPQNALIPDGIRWLMKHRDGSHWYSTQETAWSLMALTNWLSLSGEFKTDYQYAIGLNGDLLNTKQADVTHLTETTSLRLDVEKLLADQTNYLTLTRGSGPGVLYYTAYMDYSLPVKDIPALDQGILVSRQYYSPDDLKTPITEIARGELVQVRMTLVVPESLHYVVIDDPLPAGLEAVDASLLTSQQVPTKYQPDDYERYGWGWWYFYYKQIYDQKVVMSADYLPAGTYTINYLARASTAGQFHVLPATAKEFYFPDVAGRSAGTEFIVKP
jgi:uncharacterized protein YfaS (alpha-2-macroglobulin family)